LQENDEIGNTQNLVLLYKSHRILLVKIYFHEHSVVMQ